MRLIVVAEGQTEESFVKDVLAPHLNDRGVHTSVTIVGKVLALMPRGPRGGGRGPSTASCATVGNGGGARGGPSGVERIVPAQ